MKYKDQNLPNGETLSVNGYYPGNHMGTAAQGAGETDYNKDPHFVTRNTERQGTITQDAGDENFPQPQDEKAVTSDG